MASRADVVMIKGWLKFGNGKVGAPFPSALVVWGDPGLAERIAAALPGVWLILARIAA